MFSFTLLPFLLSFSSVIAHQFQENRRLPSPSWHHQRDHALSSLFRRAPDDDGVDYPDVGTPEWLSKYPDGPPDPAQMPSAWRDRLNAAVAAGKIPDIPVSSGPAFGNPSYPAGHDPLSPEICSATYKCRIDGDIWDAPESDYGLGFDDGPLPTSAKLYDFLKANNEVATGFLIGITIKQNPDMFLRAYNEGHDLAVHTYTHPHMTTQTNEQVVAQLGWTLQIIHDSAGGRVAKYWRPPYGDTDRRVSAIAREIFGLTCIIWNHDTEDWSLASGGTTPQAVQDLFKQWTSGPKDPGLIVLEHETSDLAVQSFINAYPLIKSNGWAVKSMAQIANSTSSSAYRNAPSTQAGPVGEEDILLPVQRPPTPQASVDPSSNSNPNPNPPSTPSPSPSPSSSPGSNSNMRNLTDSSSAARPSVSLLTNSAFPIYTLFMTAAYASAGFGLTHFLISYL